MLYFHSLASIKGFQATKGSSSLKRPSRTSKHEISLFLSFFVGHFFLIRIHTPNGIWIWIWIQRIQNHEAERMHLRKCNIPYGTLPLQEDWLSFC
jgi:hypothetical protein